MKHSRLVVEVVFAVVVLGWLAWQQSTIGSLRQAVSGTGGSGVDAARVPGPVDPTRRKVEATATATAAARPSDPTGPKTTGAIPPEMAALQAELRSLRQRNEALAAGQRQRIYTSDILRADGVVSDFLAGEILSEISARPPDTTGLGPDGQVAAWSGRQATGAPDTPEAGDLVTAWASRSPDAGEEWLHLTYAKPVDVAQINVHETYNPGAVSRITALLPDGSEKTLWEGTEPREEAPVEVGFPVPAGVRSDQIKVYLDTARVPGWNEIDAVELVGKDGSRQWATASSASSYYGDRR